MMLAIVILAIVASVMAACDSAGVTKCTDAYTPCVTMSAGDKAKICTCYGTYFGCLSGAGCPVDAYKSACTTAGCTEKECSSASSFSLGAAAFVAAVAARFL